MTTKTHIVTVRRDGARTLPAVNVKIRKSFADLTPAQWIELRESAEDLSIGHTQRFDLSWVQSAYQDDDESYWWNEACRLQFELSVQDAEALFGTRIECELAGRSNGWFIIDGLPEVADWIPVRAGEKCVSCGLVATVEEESAGLCSSCGRSLYLPNLKGSVCEGAKFQDGTTLPDDADIFERWRFFEEQATAYAQDVPYVCADLLLHNVYDRQERERIAIAAAEAEALKTRQALHALARFGAYVLDQMIESTSVGFRADISKDYVSKGAHLGLLSLKHGQFEGTEMLQRAAKELET